MAPAQIETRQDAHDAAASFFDFPPRSFERLKRLREETKAASDAMVIKNGLRLYEAMLEKVETESEIMAKPEKGTVPLMIFSA